MYSHDPKHQEFWKAMGNPGHCESYPEEAGESRGCCPLTANHWTSLIGNLPPHWLGVAANEACPLCGNARMDDDQLLQCTGLDAYTNDDVVSRYWEARRQMVKKPSTGVE
ncbi:hypothetical protein TNCV_2617591 [Trichonephila clavipes]|nr:hypothetical protein TNCV_2617591 [Trichonephila clavipes]